MSDYIELHVCEQPQIELEVKEQIVIGGGGIIPTGTKTINVNSNGTTTEDVTTYASAQIVANVPNSYSAGDEGKVVENGALVSQGSAEYTSNGTYDTTKISSVEVSVSGSGPSGTKQISISQNGTTTEDVAAYASAEISVSVPTGPAKTSDDLTVSGPTVTAPAGLYSSAASKSVASGTAGTPSATKGEVSNHSIEVTPSVTNSAGYIASETKTGTAVTVSASELVSGTKSITANGTGIDVTDYAAVDVSVSGGGGGVTTIASGTFTGNNNGDSTAGGGRQLINIGKKMAQTDFWIFVYVANGEEFTYSSDRQYVWLSAMARHELGGFDLSTAGHKSFVSSYSVDSNNGGTITARSCGNVIRNGVQMYNGNTNDVNTFNTFAIWRESDHFEILMGISNGVYKFPAKTYNYEVVYFGSNAATDIIEIT